jgi:FtsX-like permease family
MFGFWAIAEMVLFLGIAAVALAMIGIYGVAAFAAGRRTKEFGIRMALGAVRADILRLVLKSSAKPICSGLLFGVGLTFGLSYGLTKLMKNAPFVLDTHDPLSHFGVCLLLVLSSLVAALIPEFRATRANPVHALREEGVKTRDHPSAGCNCRGRFSQPAPQIGPTARGGSRSILLRFLPTECPRAARGTTSPAMDYGSTKPGRRNAFRSKVSVREHPAFSPTAAMTASANSPCPCLMVIIAANTSCSCSTSSTSL